MIKEGDGRWEVRRGQCDLTSLVQLNPFLPYFTTFQILLLFLVLILLLLFLLGTPNLP